MLGGEPCRERGHPVNEAGVRGRTELWGSGLAWRLGAHGRQWDTCREDTILCKTSYASLRGGKAPGLGRQRFYISFRLHLFIYLTKGWSACSVSGSLEKAEEQKTPTNTAQKSGPWSCPSSVTDGLRGASLLSEVC